MKRGKMRSAQLAKDSSEFCVFFTFLVSFSSWFFWPCFVFIVNRFEVFD